MTLAAPNPLQREEAQQADVSASTSSSSRSSVAPRAKEASIKDLVKIFKLLSDQTRLRILYYLTYTDELHVRALCELLGQSQPAVSHHLAMLRAASVVEPRRDGKHNYYRILPGRVSELLATIFDTSAEDGQAQVDVGSKGNDGLHVADHDAEFRSPVRPK